MVTKKVGRPKNKPLSKQIATRESAYDFSSLIGTLPDPDRVLEKLGVSPEIAFEDIETDDHLTAVRSKRMGKLLALEWDIVQNKASSRVTKEIKKIFENLNIRQFCKDVSRCRAWGYSPIEVIWNTNERYWYPEKLLQKPPRWFAYDDQNRLMFLSQNTYDGVIVPPYKILNPRNDSDFDNPYGIKFLSRCYWLVTFKRNDYKFWNKFLEKFSIPYLFAKVPPNTSSVEQSAILTMLGNLVQDSVGCIPNDSSLEFLEAAGKSSSADIFDKFRYSMDMAISKIWLGGTLTTEMGDVGSYSAAQTHESGEDSLVDDDANLVADTANELIKWIMHFNFTGEAPEFVMKKPFEVSKEMAETDKLLTEQGVRYNKDYYATTYGKDPKHFEVVVPTEQAPGDNSNEDDDEGEKGLSREFKDTVSKYKDQQAVDEALESISNEELQAQAEGMLNPIITMVEKSKNYREVKSKLLSQWPKMDSSAAEEMILQAIFVSEAIGRLSEGK